MKHLGCRAVFPTKPLAVFLFLGALLVADDWPQFRGPSAGVADDASLPTTWSTTANVVWKLDIAGRGWSSPVVAGDRIFLTSVIAPGPEEAPKKGLYFGGNRETPPAGEHRWMVLCVDWKTGKLL